VHLRIVALEACASGDCIWDCIWDVSLGSMGIWGMLLLKCLTIVMIITATSVVTVVADIEVFNCTVVMNISITVLLLHDEA